MLYVPLASGATPLDVVATDSGDIYVVCERSSTLTKLTHGLDGVEEQFDLPVAPTSATLLNGMIVLTSVADSAILTFDPGTRSVQGEPMVVESLTSVVGATSKAILVGTAGEAPAVLKISSTGPRQVETISTPSQLSSVTTSSHDTLIAVFDDSSFIREIDT